MEVVYSLCNSMPVVAYTTTLNTNGLFSKKKKPSRSFSLKGFYLLALLAFSVMANGYAQTVSLSFSVTPTSSNDMLAPGRGANAWYMTTQSVQIPVSGTTTTALDADMRFIWNDIEKSQGVYDFTDFDMRMKQAISKGQKMSFGIMPVCTSCVNLDAGTPLPTAGGNILGYPLYLHNLMQSESPKDWTYGGIWIPNWNSNSWLSNWEKLLNAVASHIASTSYNGVPFSSAIFHIDVRGYGNWGEWHTYPWRDLNVIPAGALATDASLQRIIAAHVTAFPNFPLINLVGAFNVSGDAGSADRSTAAVGYYALTAKNNWGPLGWRSDHLGCESTDSWIPNETTSNPYTYNSVALKTLITARWQTSPVVGEPLGSASEVSYNGAQCAYYNLQNEVTLHHISQFSNENLVNSLTCSGDYYRAASKASGYRLQFANGTISSTVSPGANFSVALNWANVGVAPVYENWNTIFELRTSNGTVAWSGTSTFKPKLFLPGTSTITDNFTLPSTVATGSYNLYLIIRDPLGYRKPLPLAIAGVGSDGSYLIKAITVTKSGSAPAGAPVVNIGAAQTITLPTSTVSLTGSLTDATSTLGSSAWTQVSGPNTATIASASSLTTGVSALIAGTYVFQLKITDLLKVSATATVQVTVLPAAATGGPVVSAGSAQTITLPTSTVTLNATASDATGSVTAAVWSQVSGPNTAKISVPYMLSTGISGLVAGTYVFQCKATDNNSKSGTGNVTVTVNAAGKSGATGGGPVVSAGAAQTITLPSSTATLNASASDATGSVTSAVWSQVSGPNTAKISVPYMLSSGISGLIAGTYVFQCKATDNNGLSGTGNVTITVNAAGKSDLVITGGPVVNAGAAQTITLPTNTVTLTGSASDATGTVNAALWTQASGPSTATISSPYMLSTAIKNLVAGAYVFTVKASDNNGLSGTASITITVKAASTKTAVVLTEVVATPEEAPVANAGTDTTTNETSLVLDGTRSIVPGGTQSTFDWTQLDGPSVATMAFRDSSTPNITNLAPGLYNFRLTVKNGSGVSSDAVVKVTVLEKTAASETILLYPNPASSVVNLRLVSGNTGTMRMSIYDMTGKVVQTAETNKMDNLFDKPFNISQLAHGMYTMQVTIGNHKSLVAKFLKQ